MTANCIPATQGEGFVALSLDSIAVNQPLSFPIFDDKRVLLVARGATLTALTKKRLEARGMTTVSVTSADAERFSLVADPSGTTSTEPAAKKATPSASQPSSPRNVPPPRTGGRILRDEIVRYHQELYSDESLQLQNERNVFNIAQLQAHVRQVMYDDISSGKILDNMVADYLHALTRDFDCVLRAVSEQLLQELPVNPLDVATIAMAMAIDMGFAEEAVSDVGFSALVADWGLLRVPAAIRDHAGPRTPQDERVYREHPQHTVRMLQRIQPLPEMVPLIVSHARERMDGSGYPAGLVGDEIHVLARVLQLAHTFVAWTTPGVRKPLMRYSAMECLLRQTTAKMRDPQAMKSLLRVQSLYPLGGLYELSDGRRCRTVRANPREFARPMVLCLPADGGALIDLSFQASISIAKAIPQPEKGEVPLTEDRVNCWE